LVISHSLVGLRSIVLDLNPSDRLLKIIDVLFWLAGIGFSIYGAWLAITIAQLGR
jgi:succinate dehydrogenase hydrophobic anchor subunit